jgi:hypothetical protein
VPSVADGICNNCGAALLGEFCHRCGQKEADTEWKSLPSIVRQFWDELVSLDYKAVRTIAALFSPGYLAAEFIAGRRGRYLSPLKVYFLAAAIFFLIAPRVTDFTFERQMAVDRDGEFHAQVEARLARTQMSRELYAERFNSRLQTIYTITPIFSVLSAAVVLRLLFGRRYPWPGPHMVFALYYIAFMFMVNLLLHGLNEAFQGLGHGRLLLILFTIVMPYMFVALRRVYAEPPGQTFWKTLVLLVLTFLIDAPINAGAALLTIRLT